MARILVIEDDSVMGEEIATELSSHGHQTVLAASGEDALVAIENDSFDAITLDRMLPGLDGLQVVADIRSRGLRTPVLMISALSDVDERITGLRAGGDDYLVKPFAPGEMAVRIEVLIRRQIGSDDRTKLNVGDIEIDLIRRSVSVGNEQVRLLHLEFRLLEFLARHAGETVSRRLIFEHVWGYYFDPGANLINVHIARLRKKLDRPDRPSAIATVKGEGYRLDAN